MLCHNELIVDAPLFEQLDVRTVLCHATVVEHEQLVGVTECGQTVRNGKGRTSLGGATDGILDLLFGLGIECRGRLVQNENARIVNERTGNRNSLALTARQRISLLANDTDGVMQALKTVTEKLNAADVVCDQITFEWLQNDFSVILTTNTFTLNAASEEEMLAFLTYLGEARQSDGIITVSYIPRAKYVTLLLDKLEDDKVIPGFEGRFSESKTTDTNEP